jgi:hypothetical protein
MSDDLFVNKFQVGYSADRVRRMGGGRAGGAAPNYPGRGGPGANIAGMGAAAEELMEKMSRDYRDPRLDFIPLEKVGENPPKYQLNYTDYEDWRARALAYGGAEGVHNKGWRDMKGASELFRARDQGGRALEEQIVKAIEEIRKNNNDAFKALQGGARLFFGAPGYDSDARQNDARRVASAIMADRIQGKSGDEVTQELMGLAYMQHRSYEAAQIAKTFANNYNGLYNFGVAGSRGLGRVFGRGMGFGGRNFMIGF